MCLTLQDETPPHRAVIIVGRVTLTDAEVTGGLHTELATRYFGKLGGREYEKMVAEENMKTGVSLITLTPDSVRGFDNHRLIGAPLRAFMRIRNALPIPRGWL